LCLIIALCLFLAFQHLNTKIEYLDYQLSNGVPSPPIAHELTEKKIGRIPQSNELTHSDYRALDKRISSIREYLDKNETLLASFEDDIKLLRLRQFVFSY